MLTITCPCKPEHAPMNQIMRIEIMRLWECGHTTCVKSWEQLRQHTKEYLSDVAYFEVEEDQMTVTVPEGE